jgi:outer membrane protein assembly factor BamB
VNPDNIVARRVACVCIYPPSPPTNDALGPGYRRRLVRVERGSGGTQLVNFRRHGRGLVTATVALGVVFLFVLSSTMSPSVNPRSPPVLSVAPAPSVTPTLPPGGNFSTYLGNPQRTSSSTTELLVNSTTAPQLHRLWSYATGSSVQSQPIVQNGTVFFGASNGYEYAVGAVNGTLLWKTFLGQDTSDPGCGYGTLGVTSTATWFGGNLYVDGGSPSLYSLNPSNGSINWNVSLGGSDAQGYYDWSSPLVYKGQVYVGIASECGNPLVAAGLDEFSIKTHHLSAYFNSSYPDRNGSSIWGSPSIDPLTNTVFVTTGYPYANTTTKYSQSIVSLNASTLDYQSSWRVPPSQEVASGGFGTTPTVFTPFDGYPMVAAPNKNGYLYAWLQSNLSGTLWQQKICCTSGDAQYISTAWGGGYLYAVTPAAEIKATGVVYNSTVRAFGPLTGKPIWSDGFSQSSLGAYAAPLWVNGLLVVPDQDTLLFLNGTTGKVLFQFNGTGGLFEAPASVSRGEIFAASTNGDVYALDVRLNSTATESYSSGNTPLTDYFSVAGSGGLPAYHYLWVFGNGNTSTFQDPQQTYTRGTYSINVSVTDLAGNVSTIHLTLLVLPAPQTPTSPPKTGFLGLPRLVGDAVAGGLVLVVVVVAVILLLRRRRSKASAQTPPDSGTTNDSLLTADATSEPPSGGFPPSAPPAG